MRKKEFNSDIDEKDKEPDQPHIKSWWLDERGFRRHRSGRKEKRKMKNQNIR